MKKVRVRFAPSPTGYLHIGGLRTALYNYLFARHHGGDFLLRIEDTDRTRYVADGVHNILTSLEWAGISHDEGPYLGPEGKILEKGDKGPYTQSERLGLYKQHAEELIAKGKAYYCFCTAERLEVMRKEQELMKVPPKYDKHCLGLSKEAVAEKLAAQAPHVIRLNVEPGHAVTFTDLIRGVITFQSETVDDQVLMKSDGFPTYHLANVVDDHFMEISHVIRGEEWLSSTPKHILLYQAFGWDAPEYAHLPLLLNADRSKLSKRQGDVATLDYARKGYLPQAMLNFVALLGWNPSDSQEIYQVQELVEKFDIAKVGKSGTVFNVEKLDWLNAHYIRQLSTQDVQKLLNLPSLPFAHPEAAIQAAKERATLLNDIQIALDEFAAPLEYDANLLVWKKSTKEAAVKALEGTAALLGNYAGEWNASALEGILKEWIAQSGLQNGDVLWPVRLALSGKEKSPPPFVLMDMYGKAESIKRLQAAHQALLSL